MKTINFILAGLLAVGTVQAQVVGPGQLQGQHQGQSQSNAATSTSYSGATSGSTSGSSLDGSGNNAQSITFNTAPGPSPKDNTPGIVAPALTTTLTETCMGSSSVGGAGPGLGISIGTTWRDGECVRRLHARELRSMNQPEIAREVMCGNVQVWDAAERVANAINRPDLACLGQRPQKEDFEVVLREEGERGEQVRMVYAGRNMVRTSPEPRTAQEMPAARPAAYREPIGEMPATWGDTFGYD